MIAGTRPQATSNHSMRKDPLYGYGKMFAELAHNILVQESLDVYAESSRVLWCGRSQGRAF